MCQHTSPPDAICCEAGRRPIGELFDAYAVCPAACDALTFLDLRTRSELLKPLRCPNGCGLLETVLTRKILI